MAEDKLKMGLSLDVDLDGFEQEWKNKQKAIQKIIDGHTFNIKIGGVQGLDAVRKEMENFSRGVKASTKVDLVNTDSIKGLKDQLRALEQEWANLSKQQKFANESTRELTPYAVELATRYAELRAELERYGMSLKEAEKAGRSFAANRARIAAEDITQPDFELLQMAEYYKIVERESAKAYEARMREQEAEAKMGESLAQAVILQNQMTQARNADYAALVKQLAAEEKLAETLHNESLRREAYQSMGQRDFIFDQMAEYYKQLNTEMEKQAQITASANKLYEEDLAIKERAGKVLAEAVIAQNQMEQARNADYAALKKQLQAESELAEKVREEALYMNYFQNMGQRDFSVEQMKTYYEQLEESSRLAKEVSDAEARRGEQRFRESQRIQAEKAKEIALRNEDYENLKRQIAEEAKLASDAEAKRGEARFRESQRVQQERQREMALQQEEYDNLIRQIQEEATVASNAAAQRGAARFRESQRIQEAKARELQLQQEEYESLRKQLREEAKLASMQKNRRDNERYTSQQRRISEGKRIQQILTTEAKTLDAINLRLAIQRQRLGQVAIGSSQYKKIEKDIAALEARLRSLDDTQRRSTGITDAQTDAFQRQSGVLNGLKQFMNAYVSILGVKRLVTNIKDITSEFELQRVSLRAITQDAQFADALFTKIKVTATESPFSTKDLVTYTKQLAAYRIENEQLYGTMNMLADISAGLGVSMDRLILAYGQVKAASVLRGTELRQFTEAGIPLVDELAKKFSQLRGEVVSTGEVFDLISTRQVPFEMVADIFKEMTAEGGRFYEMQKKQSESLYGVFENLKDNIQNAYDEIGQSNRGLLMGIGKMATVVAKNLSTITAAMNPILATWGAYRLALKLSAAESSRLAASNALLLKAEQALAASRATTNIQTGLAYKLMIQAKIANDRYAIATIRAATANSVLARSFYKIQAALIANPLIAVLTGTAAVLVGSITLWNKYKESLSSSAKSNERVAKSVEEIQKPLQDANKSYERIIKKIKEYDVLLNTQEKSLSELKRIYPELFSQYKTDEERQKAVAEATNKRVAAINELKSLSPELLSAIDSESASVQALAEAWGDVTQAMRDNEVEALKVKKANTEALIATARRNLQTWQEKRDSTSDTDQQRIWNAMMAAEEKKIEGLEKDLAGYNRELEALKKATDDAAAAQLLWRKEYNKFMKGDTLKDHELAALNFANTIKETRDAWKDATDRAKEYQDAIDAAKTQKQTAEVRKNVEEYKKQLATQQQIIKNAESYAKFAGFSLQTGGKVDTTPLDNLKAELSLVEKIYKRYGELRRLMSDEAAKADIEEIYGGLTNVDFLSPEKLRVRLQKMLEEAERLGDKDLAIQLGLKIQDINTNEIKDKLEKALSRLSNQIKQQQDASEFFEKMLGWTGDVELSTNLTLATTGVDIQSGNVGQMMSRQLAEILSTEPVKASIGTEIDLTGDWNADDLEDAISKGEISVHKLQELANKLPKDVQPQFREALASFVDFNKGQVSELFKTIDKYGDVETKIALLKTQFESKKLDFSSMINPAPDRISKDEWAEYIRKGIEAAEKAYNEELGKVKLEGFQKQFVNELENLDAVTKEKSEEMITVLDGILGSVKLDPTQLKTLTDYKEKLRDVFFKLQPTEEAKKAWDALWKAINGGDKDAGAKAKSDLVKSLDSMIDKAKDVETIMNNIIDSTLNIADALGITFSDDTQDAINHFKGGIGSIISGLTSAKSAIELFKGTDTTLKNLSLAGVALGATFATISWISNTKVRAANKEIERQEKLLKSLERAYDRLEETQEQLVGTDWVRNQQQQIANLQRQISAFEAQRTAEQSKGKKRDEDAIEDYTDKILDAQKQIRELQRGVTEEMVGTGLPDAAKDFAQSWLDAYLSFDDTMGALKSSFKDMMKTMVQNSMMAKLVQKRLEPVFAAIDKAYEDAELTPAEWQGIMDMGNKAIEFIDEDLTHLAEMLGLRNQLGEQDTSNLTGIAKGVAQASEETVLTLAGYANSILYYQVWIKDDVAAIRAILEGKVAAVAPATSSDSGFNVGQLVSLQQQSLSQLQAINANTGNTVSQLQELNNKIDSVISAQGTSSRKVVNTRLSN